MLCVRHNCSTQDVILDKLMRTKSVTGLFNYHIGIHVSLCNMKQKQVLTFSSFFTYLQKLWLQLLREHGSSILHPLHTDWVIITQKQDIQPIAYHMGQSRRFTRRSSACFVLLHSTRSTFDAIFPAQLVSHQIPHSGSYFWFPTGVTMTSFRRNVMIRFLYHHCDAGWPTFRSLTIVPTTRKDDIWRRRWKW